MLKFLASIMIIASSSILGYSISREYSRRPAQLRELQILMQIFENEIRFLSSVLASAFEKLYKTSNSEVREFFIETIKNLESSGGYGAKEAWEKAVRDNIKNTSLNNEDQEILLQFGNILGSTDKDGQISNIRHLISRLKIQEEKAEEMRKKNESLYRKLGLLGGLAIVIVLL
ncbi:MAG TPA: stage III sporulation protein AB [Clostridiaceae bacterium]|nr:stage III sporulation protein AB [Clostridiaceae bacterium]